MKGFFPVENYQVYPKKKKKKSAPLSFFPCLSFPGRSAKISRSEVGATLPRGLYPLSVRTGFDHGNILANMVLTSA